MQPLTVLVYATVAGLAAAFMPRRSTVCSIHEDPIVTPFTGPQFDFERQGTYYAIQSTEMSVSITTGVHWAWLSLGYVAVVDSIRFECGSKPAQVFTADDLTSKSLTLPCDSGACTGASCFVTIAKGTWPYNNVDLQAISYTGNQGICGLCYNTDCNSVKPVPPSPPTPGSYCKPVARNGDLSLCSIFDDPLVSPFNTHKNFEYDVVGPTYAVLSDEFSVEFVI
ncbi:hypothetical protein HDU99_006006, partial [Rhizoclosmatium hyalinum]